MVHARFKQRRLSTKVRVHHAHVTDAELLSDLIPFELTMPISRTQARGEQQRQVSDREGRARQLTGDPDSQP